jgi:hypothetical protein
LVSHIRRELSTSINSKRHRQRRPHAVQKRLPLALRDDILGFVVRLKRFVRLLDVVIAVVRVPSFTSRIHAAAAVAFLSLEVAREGAALRTVPATTASSTLVKSTPTHFEGSSVARARVRRRLDRDCFGGREVKKSLTIIANTIYYNLAATALR